MRDLIVLSPSVLADMIAGAIASGFLPAVSPSQTLLVHELSCIGRLVPDPWLCDCHVDIIVIYRPAGWREVRHA